MNILGSKYSLYSFLFICYLIGWKRRVLRFFEFLVFFFSVSVFVRLRSSEYERYFTEILSFLEKSFFRVSDFCRAIIGSDGIYFAIVCGIIFCEGFFIIRSGLYYYTRWCYVD